MGDRHEFSAGWNLLIIAGAWKIRVSPRLLLTLYLDKRLVGTLALPLIYDWFNYACRTMLFTEESAMPASRAPGKDENLITKTVLRIDRRQY